ncbi:MAG TPA: hypothetical protein VHO70_13955 [Chitinispirillaceae bacterium]|nr:hypothetical protein [Chitinispirillaceae bacterium]
MPRFLDKNSHRDDLITRGIWNDGYSGDKKGTIKLTVPLKKIVSVKTYLWFLGGR